MNFLNVLCDCADDYLFLVGDFNCTEDSSASSARLRHLMKTRELKDVWRGRPGLCTLWTL